MNDNTYDIASESTGVREGGFVDDKHASEREDWLEESKQIVSFFLKQSYVRK